MARRYRVFNHTDEIWASPLAMTREQADEFVKDFRRRYEQQGYYRTASGERIQPEDVSLEIVRSDED